MARPRTTPVANAALAAASDGSGRTYASVAAAISQVAAEDGLPARCTAASPGKWSTAWSPSRRWSPLRLRRSPGCWGNRG